MQTCQRSKKRSPSLRQNQRKVRSKNTKHTVSLADIAGKDVAPFPQDGEIASAGLFKEECNYKLPYDVWYVTVRKLSCRGWALYFVGI